MRDIHPTAVIAPSAELADEVSIGPYCVVGSKVTLGTGTRLMSHVVIDGLTTLGAHCTVFPFASLGQQTQDLKFKGGTPGVRIGDHVTIRESVTVNAATYDGNFTTVGNHCHIMAYAHVAHDCHVGHRVIMANNATLAGHVIVEDQSVLGGLTAVHQFVRVGRLSITGGCSRVVKDIPPYMMAAGNPAGVHTINKVGLERAGASEDVLALLKKAFKILYHSNLTAARAVEEINQLGDHPELKHLTSFVQASERGITR